MSHDRPHHHETHTEHHEHKPKQPWPVIVAVVIMIGAMAIYVASMDEALPPGTTQPAMPMPAAGP